MCLFRDSVLDAYEGSKANQLNDALGIFVSFSNYLKSTIMPIPFQLLVWFIITLIMFFGTFRSSISLAALFFFLDITFLLLMIGEFMEKRAFNFQIQYRLLTSVTIIQPKSRKPVAFSEQSLHSSRSILALPDCIAPTHRTFF
jgi:hypothetical protein